MHGFPAAVPPLGRYKIYRNNGTAPVLSVHFQCSVPKSIFSAYKAPCRSETCTSRTIVPTHLGGHLGCETTTPLGSLRSAPFRHYQVASPILGWASPHHHRTLESAGNGTCSSRSERTSDHAFSSIFERSPVSYRKQKGK